MRFIITYRNHRDKFYRATTSAGNNTSVQGWDAGVKVTPRGAAKGPDSFDVYMTGGSHDAHGSVHVGAVQDTPGGPEWIPDGQVLTLAQIRNGTGFRRGTRFVEIGPPASKGA
jgi:hypothetical protein